MSRFAFAPFCALLLCTAPAQAQSISGSARAVDGDTLDITGQEVRLQGIDAPEAQQTCLRDGASWPCGAAARDQLAMLVANAEVACESVASSTGTIIARCEANGIDLAESMVAAGLATVPNAADADYAAMADRVQVRRLGIWAGSFDAPAVWRKAHPEAVRKPAASRTAQPSRSKTYRGLLGCAIKGNISRRMGENIYYLPGMKYYDGTRPERLFCTEEEAQAAGYRRSRGGYDYSPHRLNDGTGTAVVRARS